MSSNNCETRYYIGVDVGTSSVRAALFSDTGRLVSSALQSITIWTPKPDHYEQSSEDIWRACCVVVKKITEAVPSETIRGIGFDATCSLVALDENGSPVSVSSTGCSNQNIIMWLDHRALQETDFINSLQHNVLHFVGGKISVEMQTPKLLWLKKNLCKECWERAAYFLGLPDFLTWRATGAFSRSLCSLVCKWTYQADASGNKYWSESYFKQIGLEDLIENNWKKIGCDVKTPGSPCGSGLSSQAASELCLKVGTSVGTSILDAHAGGLGMLGCNIGPAESEQLMTQMGLVCGTSTCHLAISREPVHVPGVWGPYYSAMVPGYWLNEGGQSAAGKLIDHVIDSHPARKELEKKIELDSSHVQDVLYDILQGLVRKRGVCCLSQLTHDLHVWPDFHGNRSPVADASLKGMVSGLTLATGEEDLACMYLATIQALSYGTRHILETLQKSGHTISTVLICGGVSNSSLFVQTQADVLGLPVVRPHQSESVLLGAAILGACASRDFPTIIEAMRRMGGKGELVMPNEDEKRYHDRKYRVFLKMLEDQQSYRDIMNSM